MARNTVVNLDIRKLSDGFYIGGGATERVLQLNSANVEFIGQQNCEITLPDYAATTLVAYHDYAAKGDILAASGANTPEVLSVGSNGQVLMADSAESTGLKWASIESVEYETITSSQAAEANKAYIIGAGAGAQVDLSLPASSAVGDIIKIYNLSSNLWSVTQGAGQQVHMLGASTTSGATGSLTSTTQYDAIELVCVVADTIWIVADATGNFDIA